MSHPRETARLTNQDLHRKYAETKDPALREEIVRRSLSLVEHFARNYRGRGIDYDDLFQEGCLGLLLAIERYDPDLGYSFSTFTSYYIKGHITQYFRDKGWPCAAPRSVKTLCIRIKAIADELGHEPTREELMEMDIADPGRIEEAMLAARVWEPICLHKTESASGINPVVLRKLAKPDKEIESIPAKLTLEQAMSQSLTEEEEKAIRLYFFDDYPQRTIADELSTYQMRVSRLIRSGTSKLTESLAEESEGARIA